MDFRQFAMKRFQILSREYTEDGVNQGMFRDNLLDVLEELADALMITKIAVVRGLGPAIELERELEDLGQRVIELWHEIPDEFKREVAARVVKP